MQEVSNEIEFPQYILKNLVDKYPEILTQKRIKTRLGLQRALNHRKEECTEEKLCADWEVYIVL